MGPSAATGKKSKAPINRIVPSRTKPNVIVSVRNVPTVMGVGFLPARLAAKAMGAMIGTKRLINMTKPVTMSSGRLSGAGGEGLSSGLLNPQVSPSPQSQNRYSPRPN